ncbi:hypothetical protein B0J11DRAFT_151027 [Dendryphion nanum]|uniref:Tachykinin family protein n=1 Tax=Dendryphion nanum TaxID=256645 RepID=A0A9P9EDC4_9PLEO|nr:hypothetical protein B0J11DRAFT_151027 [Dendryphion nanum]
MDHSSQPIFSFINLTHPDELKDEETQSRIRRLAMTEVGRKRRKPKTKRGRNEIILEFRDIPISQSHAPFERIGSGEVDPFVSYPIHLDEKSRALVVNIFRKNGSHSTILRGSWWPVALSNAAAFHTALSSSQLYICMNINQSYVFSDDATSLEHHSRALKLVNEMMNDPTKHTTNELLGAVAAFMCHDYIMGGFDSWGRHRTALSRMIELRGGVDTVTGEQLRITLSWCDLTGAFSQDIPTIFPMPRQWEADSRSPPSSPRPESEISLRWKQWFPTKQDWISIFDDVTQLISLDRALTDQQFKEATASGCWMEPTIVRLLSIRPLQHSSDKENVLEEICRIGTLLFLAPIWRALGASPVWTNALLKNLLWTLNNHISEWADLRPLLAWTIYFAAIETSDPSERAQFVFFLAVLMTGARMKEWDELMYHIKSVLWVENIFAGRDTIIREEVMSLLTRSPSAEPMIEEVDA